MASTIFHHWLDQFRALPPTRQRWIRGVFRVIAIIVIFFAGFAIGRAFGFPDDLQARAHRLATRNATLEDQLQGLQQQQQTDATALAALKSSLAGRDAELQKLEREQAFYARLIGIDSNRSGLGVHSMALSPVTGTHAWNFTVTLVNTAENADAARGTLTLSIEGVRDGKLATIGWSNLAAPAASDGVPFAFKFFQQLRGSFLLPKGFVPNRVTVILHPEGGEPVTRRIDWKEALDHQGSEATTP